MKMSDKKYTIWQNFDVAVDDWREDYQESHGLTDDEMAEIDDDEVWRWASYVNDDYLDDERCNLDINVGEEIIVLGDLGLWNGRAHGYRIIRSGNIKDCLSDEDCSYCHWYCDRYDMRCTGAHHDGRNYYLYRTWAKGLSDDQKETFLEKVYRGTVEHKDVLRYTRSIRPWVSAVYGWGGRVEKGA